MMSINSNNSVSRDEFIKTVNIDTDIPNATDYTIIDQTHVLDANMYVSFHSYVYSKVCGDNSKLEPNFNKNFTFTVKCVNMSDGVSLINLKDSYHNGSVFIHDSALSPPNIFNFKIDNSYKSIYLIVHGFCDEVEGANVLTLFTIHNDLYKSFTG